MPGEEPPVDDASDVDDEPAFEDAVKDDWQQMAEGLRRRREEAKGAKRKPTEPMGEDDEDLFDDRDSMSCRRCLIYVAAAVLALLIVGAYQAWVWFHPEPVSCSLELVRPQKFKIDVTDFFSPKVSAAVQLVLKLRNSNMMRSMLLEQCKVTAFDDETGLKLGSAQQGSLVLSPFSTTQVTVSLNQLAGALPPPEQRRLAAAFLAKKALLLTLVATASSRIPKKGTTAAQVTTNTSRRVDLSALTKEPFFQRAPAPPPPDDPGSEGEAKEGAAPATPEAAKA